MANKKITRRALVMSVISLILCCAMLVGTTFAWFTDSVTSSNNIIKSGNLDVEMYWAYGKDDPTSDTTAWTDASTDAIFDYDKWEPGYTDVRHIKIENKGTLALKYHINIDATDEVSELADVIDVYFINPAVQVTSRDGLSTEYRVGTLSKILEGMPANTAGILKEEETATVTIALKMQESAGNEYQNLSIGSDFKVILNATQLVEEEDSFGNDYDEGLILPEVDEELLFEKDGIQYYIDEESNDYVLYLVTEKFVGETLAVPEGVTSIGNYAFSYNSNVKEVILSSTVRDLGRGFAGSAVEKVVLNEGLTSISSRAFRETKQLKDVVFSSTVKIIEDNAFQKSGIKSIVIPASVETIGETAFGASLIESVTFEDNTSIQGYAFRGCTKLHTVTMYGDNVTFIESTLNKRNSCWFCNSESNNPNTSDIDFYVVNATVAQSVKTAMGAEANNTDVIVMIDGSKDLMKKHGASENEYIVTSAAGLAKLNAKMADKSLGRDVVVNLTNNIDFTGYTWTPVDSHADTAFTMKEINGNGYTISNLTINGQAMFTRFAGSGDVTIKNITFDNATVDSNGAINTSILTVQSYQNVLLDNVDVKNSTITGGYKVAPLIATVYNENDSSTITATLKGCDVENVTVKATSYDFCTTGMVAFVNADDNDTIVFENCSVTDVKLYAPNVYTAHAAIYTTDSETLFNEAEGVTVTNVTFENI